MSSPSAASATVPSITSESPTVLTDTALRGEVYAKSALLMGAAAGTDFLEARRVHYATVTAPGTGVLPAAA